MTIKHLVPEIPVQDVEIAQVYYRDTLGFTINWLYADKKIGAVSNDAGVTMFFRKRSVPFEPVVHWVFADDVDTAHQALLAKGANIVEGIENKPWGLRQFTIEDLDGNRFYFHHDLPADRSE